MLILNIFPSLNNKFEFVNKSKSAVGDD